MRQYSVMSSGVVWSPRSTRRRGSVTSAITCRPRVWRKLRTVAFLSPDMLASMNHETGLTGEVSRMASQTAWVQKVTMFCPAASAV